MLDVLTDTLCMTRRWYLKMDKSKNTYDNVSKCMDINKRPIVCKFRRWYLEKYENKSSMAMYVQVDAYTRISISVFIGTLYEWTILVVHTCGINRDVIARQSPGKTVKRFFCGLHPPSFSTSLFQIHPKHLWQRKAVTMQGLSIAWSFTQEFHSRRPLSYKLHSRSPLPKKLHPWSPFPQELHAWCSFANKFHAWHSFMGNRWVGEGENLR